MKLTRRQFVVGTAAGAVGAAGLYELVDQFTGGSPQRAAAAAKLPEQHLLEGVRVVRSDGVEVLVPPLHHQILTARVAVGRGDLPDARVELEGVLVGARRRLRAVAGRARRDGRVGAAVSSTSSFPTRRSACCRTIAAQASRS